MDILEDWGYWCLKENAACVLGRLAEVGFCGMVVYSSRDSPERSALRLENTRKLL